MEIIARRVAEQLAAQNGIRAVGDESKTSFA